MERETEIKIVVERSRFQATAEQFNFKCVHERTWEENLLWDLPDRRLTKSGQMLRLRAYGRQVSLTWKGSMREDAIFKERDEVEVRVDRFPAARELLERLGFRVWFRYQKFRTLYQWSDLKIAYDETPIGAFVELEGPPRSIERAIEQWGWQDCPRLRATYHDLFEEARKRGAFQGDHLVFPGSGD